MTIDDFLDYLLEGAPEKYDTSVGSFLYDIMYPFAEQLYMLDKRIDEAIDNAFVETADTEHLIMRAKEDAVEPKEATYASGTVKITGRRGSVAPKGTKFAADMTLYASKETVTIPEEGFIEVEAVCTEAGSKGNKKIGEINRFPITVPGLTEVVNTTEFTGGYDAESDSELRERRYNKVAYPNTSGNSYHYETWAREVEGVGAVQITPLWNGGGTVKVVIVDSDNQPASDDLIEKVKSHIEEMRPIGADVTVVSATPLNVDISVKLICEDAESIKADIEDAIKQYLAETALKKSYISYAKIGSLILSLSKVEDYNDLKINGQTENIPISAGVVPVLGGVSVE